MLSTLPNQSNDRIQPLTTQSLQQRDSLPGKPKLATLQNHQRLHPTQTFGEYVANNSQGPGKSRMPMNLPPANSVNGNGPLNPLIKLSSHETNTTTGLSTNGHMTNSSSAIGHVTSTFSAKGVAATNHGSRVETAQHSPILPGQISEKHLQIEV